MASKSWADTRVANDPEATQHACDSVETDEHDRDIAEETSKTKLSSVR